MFYPNQPSSGDLANLRFALPIIKNAVDEDRSRFFSLADQVITDFAARRWDTIISDASRGVVVGEFLAKILNSASRINPTSPVSHIPIANSRIVGETMKSRRTQHKAVREYLGNTGIQRALLVTDTVDSGTSMHRLGKSVNDSGIEADYAVLSSAHTHNVLRAKIHQPKYSQLYTTAPSAVESATAGNTIAQGIGLKSVVGIAKPQLSEHAWPLVGLATREQYSALADEYLAQIGSIQYIHIEEV